MVIGAAPDSPSGSYTPGVGAGAVAFMAERTVHTHAAYAVAHLESGMSVVDVGCGPGTITVGLAARVAPGPVLGIDRSGAQLAGARALARQLALGNVRFVEASCDRMPLEDNSVDFAFCHALLEHLDDPVRALTEMRRVLRPRGRVAVCSPDWGGFILSPPTPAVEEAVRAYTALMERNGGDPHAGRRLVSHLRQAGFSEVRAHARYEQYADPSVIARYLADQLLAAGRPDMADALTTWAADESAMFAQAWVSAVGIRGSDNG